METFDKRVLGLFADILDYPHPGLEEVVGRCRALVAEAIPVAADLLGDFLDFVGKTSTERIEELYTCLFDLNPVYYPYVGYHIFGESYKRTFFMLALKEQYRAWGFNVPESDLADRLPVVLRFLSISEDREVNGGLIREGLLPALERMIKSTENEAKPALKRDYQPEGFCHGEIFQGGFLLKEMKEAAANDGLPYSFHNPYRRVVAALRIVLRTLLDDQDLKSELPS